MRETQSKQIGASTYYVAPLAATPARHLAAKMMRIAGSGGSGISLTGLNKLDVIVALIGAIMATASEAEIDAIAEILCTSTMVDPASSGKKIALVDVMETHFAGALEEQVQWMAYAAQVHIGPLAEWLKSQAEKVIAEMAAKQAESLAQKK